MRVGKKELPAARRSESVVVSSTTLYGAGVDLRNGLLPRRARTAALAGLHHFYTQHLHENRGRSRSLVRRRVLRPSSAPVRRSAALPIVPPPARLERSVSFHSSASRSPSRSPANRRRVRPAAKSAGPPVPKTTKGRRTRTAKQSRAEGSKSKGGSARRVQSSYVEQKANKATKGVESSDVEQKADKTIKDAQSSDIEQKADKTIKDAQSSDIEQKMGKATKATKDAQSSDAEQKANKAIKAIKGAQSGKKATRAAKSPMRGAGC